MPMRGASSGAQQSAKEQRRSDKRLRRSVARERAKIKAGTSSLLPGNHPGDIRSERRKREDASRKRLQRSVTRERTKIKAGTSTLAKAVKQDSGDVMRGAKPVSRAELARSRRAQAVERRRKAAQNPKIAGIPLGEVAKTLIKGGKIGEEAAKFGGRFAKDIATLPITIPQGAYESGAALVEAAQGDYKRARRLYEGFVEHDPFALAAQGKWKEAGKAISDHPGLFAVEVYGAKSTAGRGTTKIQEKRGGNPTTRESAHDPVTRFEVKRTYSRDASHRVFQKRNERRKITHAEAMRMKADAMEKAGSSDNAITELRHQANRIDPRVATGKQTRVAAARAYDVGKIIGERHEGTLDKTLKAALKAGGEKPTAAVVLAAQRVTDVTPESLKSYRDRLQKQAESGKLGAAELAANRMARTEIDKALDAKHDPAKLKAATQAVEDVLKPLQQRLVDEGILAAPRARKAPLVGYAVTRMEGVRPGKNGPVRDVEGKANPVKVKAAEIEAHMRAHNIDPGVFLSQRPARVAGGPGGQAFSSQRISGQARTGHGVTVGTADLNPDIIRRTARTQQRLLDHADAYRAKLRQFGAPHFMTRSEAVKMATDMQAKHGIEYVAVPRYPFAGDKSVAQMAAEGVDPDSPAAKQWVQDAIDRALSGNWNGQGDFTVMAKAASDELRAQGMNELPGGAVSTTFRAVSTHFTRNVLSTSPSWITGNAVEGQVRSWFAGTRPGDAELFKKVVERMREIDPRLADELQSYGSGAGHHGSAGRLDHGRFLAQYETSSVAPLAHKLSAFWQRPTPTRVAGAWNAYTDFMFKTVSGRLESNFQASMSGALIRKSNLIDPKLPKLSEKAIDQAARGLMNTPEQAALGEALGHMFGRYSGRTADAKWAITTFTPFANWAISAADFVFRVLPRDHPAITTLSVALDNATQDLYDNDALPGWLRGSIVLPNDAKLRISRYLPFSAFASPTETLSHLVMPQFSSTIKAFVGMDWTGEKLYNKDGSPISEGQRAMLAAQAFLEGVVPFWSKIKQTAEKGPMSIPKSTVGYVKQKDKKPKVKAAPTRPSDELLYDDAAGGDDLILEGAGDGGDDLILGAP